MAKHRKSRKPLTHPETFVGRGDRLPSILFPFGREIESADGYIDFVVRITLPRATSRKKFLVACDRLYTKAHERAGTATKRALAVSALALQANGWTKDHSVSTQLKVSPSTLSRVLKPHRPALQSKPRKARRN